VDPSACRIVRNIGIVGELALIFFPHIIQNCAFFTIVASVSPVLSPKNPGKQPKYSEGRQPNLLSASTNTHGS
jgi:hypothetical protein